MNTGKGRHMQKQYDMRIQKMTEDEYMNTVKGKQYDIRIQKMTMLIYLNKGKGQHTQKQYDLRIQKITTGIYEYRKRSAYTKTI